MTHQFYGGTSGIALHVSRDQFPAEFKDAGRLEYYAHLFNSLEVNSIFYKLPRAATVEKWIDAVDDDFRFTFKMSKSVSHSKGLAFDEKDVKQFVDIINIAQSKKGCILIQFPPSLKNDAFNNLSELLECVHTYAGQWRIAIELRNLSWYNENLYDLLQKFSVALVHHDLPTAPPLEDLRLPFSYFRFHGPGGRYRNSYSNEFLEEYAGVISQRLQGGDVFCYFNNTMGNAAENLLTLNKMVKNRTF